MYPAELVAPMKAELVEVGFEELLTPEDVSSALERPGTTIVALNSVCGCSAGRCDRLLDRRQSRAAFTSGGARVMPCAGSRVYG